ncbi:MAG: amidohydrolase [Chloroflexota bacterium]
MPDADLILKNASVLTMNPAQPAAELVAIKDHRILLVGRNESLELVKGARTRVIDCQGKTVVPGFNDAHCHIFAFIRMLLSTDLSPAAAGSITAIKAAIRQRAQDAPAGQWLTGTGYNEFYLAEKRHPTRWDLDEAAPQHPVVLAHRSLHACVLNSLALKLAGITRETPEPPGGLIDRDPATGEPNGRLFNMLGYIRERVLPPLSGEELARGAALANQHYLSLGITSLQEASAGNDPSRWQTLGQLKISNTIMSRVSMMLGGHALSEFQEAGLAPGSGDAQLRLGGVKIILSQATGRLDPPQPELNRRASTIHRAGFQLALHAVEEGEVAAAITALEHVSRQPPRADRRHRIEHCSECPPHLLKRLSKLKALVVTQPPFLYYSGERYLAEVPQSQQPWLYRLNSFLSNGITVAASSDSPVAPNNPLIGIYAAVTRRAEAGVELPAAERIPADAALAMYTINAAYASFEERIKGSLTGGKLADMVVLSHDPLTSPPEQLKDIRVEMTIIDGRVAWEV